MSEMVMERARNKDQQTRFWSKVNKGDINKCWPWNASLSHKGYGQAIYLGRHHNASRLAWIFTYGDISSEIQVCHKCDNPICCNPNHLFIGTNYDNVRDMIAKGRDWRGGGCHGERNGRAKLSRIEVQAIKRSLRDGVSQRKLAKTFQVSRFAIYAIAHNKTWMEKKTC